MTTVITGAANGLGYALALACQARGDQVLAIDHDGRGLAQLGLAHLTLDLTRADAPAQIATALTSPCRLIIHCAGISGTGKFEDIPAAHHAKIMALNLEVPMQITSHLLARKAFAPDARHVFIGSLSSYTGYPGATSYAASKDGLASFARSLNKVEKGRVHCVFPGPIRTEHAARYAPDNSAKALSRRQSPQDAAHAILRGVSRGHHRLFTSPSTRALAVAGRLMPGLVGRALRRGLFEKMDRVSL